jgi:hypothetical protein
MNELILQCWNAGITHDPMGAMHNTMHGAVQVIFIGRGLDDAALRAGFASCLVPR